MEKWSGQTDWQKVRFAVLRRDKFTCKYCGGKPPAVVLHVDHLTPRSRGGSDSPSNLVASCSDCNEGKAAQVLTASEIKLARRAPCGRCGSRRGDGMTVPGGERVCAVCRKKAGLELIGCDKCGKYFWTPGGCQHERRHGYDRLCGGCCVLVRITVEWPQGTQAKLRVVK